MVLPKLASSTALSGGQGRALWGHGNDDYFTSIEASLTSHTPPTALPAEMDALDRRIQSLAVMVRRCGFWNGHRCARVGYHVAARADRSMLLAVGRMD